MNTSLKVVVFAFLVISQSSLAGTLSNISFVSNSGSFINDTINNGSSPLGITNTGSVSNPFLNNFDSTVSLGFGDYYVISFLGRFQHIGSGTVSFQLDGSMNFSQAVVFPPNSPAGVVFASFSLPGGDSVQISTTGLAADRIRFASDDDGLWPGAPDDDAFYLLSYAPASDVPEPSSFGFAAAGLAALAVLSRKK